MPYIKQNLLYNIIISVVCIIAGTFLIFKGLTSLGSIYSPISAKDKVEGIITNIELQEHTSNTDKILVYYQYTINNNTYKGKSYVYTNYNKKVGDTINVYYKEGYENDSLIVCYNIIPYIVMGFIGFVFFAVGIAIMSSLIGFNDNLERRTLNPNVCTDLANNREWKETIARTKQIEDERNQNWRKSIETGEFTAQNKK